MNFTVAGYGDFTGTFHFFKGGTRAEGHVHEPRGRRQRLAISRTSRGSLLWVPNSVPGDRRHHRPVRRPREVRLFDGAARTAATRRRRCGTRRTPTSISRSSPTSSQTQGLRLAGRASGHNRLEWPLGKFAQKHGEGEITATAPGGITPLTRERTAGSDRARSIRCRRSKVRSTRISGSATCRSPARSPTRSIPSGSR